MSLSFADILKKKETKTVVKSDLKKGWVELDIKNLKNLNKPVEEKRKRWLSFDNFKFEGDFTNFDLNEFKTKTYNELESFDPKSIDIDDDITCMTILSK